MNFFQTKWYCCCLVLLLLCVQSYAQINFTGRVVDENGDTPLAGASVYFNKTTTSTNTNSQGYFTFEAIRLINTDLIIFVPGYDVIAYRPNATQVEKKRIVFKLRKSRPVENKLAIPASVRKRCLEIFYSNLLGVSREAMKCTITNEQSIYFMPGNGNTDFIAYADTPLVIINTVLGYKMNYNLLEFVYDDATGQSDLEGFMRYEDLGNDKKWIKSRKDCYLGSSLHFYRSLISNQLYEQGFGAFLLEIDSSAKNQSRKLSQVPGYGIVKTSPIAAQQILFIDSTNNISIRIDGQLLVQYYKIPASREFLNRNGFMAGSVDRGIQSFLFFKGGPVGINIAGVLSDPAAVDYAGFWIYEKAANTLPYDYKPE